MENKEIMEEENGIETTNPVHALAKRLRENKGSLHISRVPEKTKEVFVTLAEAEFCGDYGMALKWLVDDLMGQDTRMILARLEDHELRLQQLELAKTKKPAEKTGRKMLDGKVIGGKEQ